MASSLVRRLSVNVIFLSLSQNTAQLKFQKAFYEGHATASPTLNTTIHLLLLGDIDGHHKEWKKTSSRERGWISSDGLWTRVYRQCRSGSYSVSERLRLPIFLIEHVQRRSLTCWVSVDRDATYFVEQALAATAKSGGDSSQYSTSSNEDKKNDNENKKND